MRRRIKSLFSPEAQANPKGVLIDLLTLAKEGPDFPPAAGLIFDGVLLILESLDKSAENVQVLEELRSQVESLPEIFASSEDTYSSPVTSKEIEKLKIELEEVIEKIKDRTSHDRFKRFKNRKYNEDDLRSLSVSISSLLTGFRTSRKLRLEKEEKLNELSHLLDKLHVVNAPHEELDRIYIQVLSNVIQESMNSPIFESFLYRYQSIVGSIVLLRDPLPMESLARFTEHRVEDIESTLFGLHPIIVVPGGGDPPSINYTSFLDFIADPHRCLNPNLRIDRSSRERWFAIRCFELLTANLKQDILGTDDLSLYNDEIQDLQARVKDAIPPEIRYACLHWVSHLIMLESSDAELLNLLEVFASKYAINWFEATSLLESAPSAAFSIGEVYKWAVKMNCRPVIKTLLRDKHHFAVANKEDIAVAALHVYRLYANEPRDLTGQVTWYQRDRVGQGRYSTVYHGVWRRRGLDKTREVKIVVKELTWNSHTSEEQLHRRLKREVLLWHKLRHRNIAEFFGFLDFRTFNRPAAGLVSRLYVNGNVNAYLKSHSLSNSEKQSLCCDIALGLGYLHGLSPPVVHGDLKPDNVLVDADGRAVLCDFGMARILGHITGLTTQNIFGGTQRYLPPEVYVGDDSIATTEMDDTLLATEMDDTLLTTERDVYAFGCVCVEIIIQKHPFPRNPGNFIAALIQKKPPYTADDLLNVTFLPGVLVGCFNSKAKSRPTMSHILRILNQGNVNAMLSSESLNHEHP